MNEVEIVAKLVVSRLKTDYKFAIDNIDEFFERMDAWKKELKAVEKGKATVDLKKQFEEFRKAYPGVKRGLDVEYANFIKKYSKDAGVLIPTLMPALRREMAYHNRCASEGRFCPEYQHLKTWINNRSWELVFPEPVTLRATLPQPKETQLKYAR